MNIEDTIQQFREQPHNKAIALELPESVYDDFMKRSEDFLRNALQGQERDIYQNVADNFGYLLQTDGDIRVEAKVLHEHFLGLALKANDYETKKQR